MHPVTNKLLGAEERAVTPGCVIYSSRSAIKAPLTASPGGELVLAAAAVGARTMFAVAWKVVLFRYIKVASGHENV